MAHLRTKAGSKTKLKNCPECGSLKVVPIVHGVPTPEQEKALREGKAVRANREEWEGMTEWYCQVCGCDWSREWRRFKRPQGA